MNIAVRASVAALLLACAGGTAWAQEAPQVKDPTFDLGALPIDPEELLTTNAGAMQADEEDCDPSVGPTEIVVCAPDNAQFRIESPTQEAIRTGKAIGDGLPRAPDLAEPCTGVCIPIGPVPYRPILIDLASIPEALPAEVAEKVRYGLTAEERAAAEAGGTLHDPYLGEAERTAGEAESR